MATKFDASADQGPEVVVKPQAYIKMVKHVLLYGNSNLADSVEVMGICYGKEEDGKLIQYDAVPISHGGAIEVEFSPEDYAAFAMADEQFADKGYYAIGWYHSHPGLKAFFSKTDIKNHLFYQKDQTPYAYGIVFDHTYFDQGDEALKWGFKAFRLDDYRQGMKTDFHEIPFTVEIPDDLSYYHEIDSIIENVQKKKPIIQEARETFEGGGTWEEPTAEGEEAEEADKSKADPFTEIKQGFHEGMDVLSNQMMLPIMDDLQQFTKDTQTAALKGPGVMIKSLEEMRDTIENGLSRVQSFFEKTLEKEIADVNKSVEDQIKKFVKDQQAIPEKMNAFIEKMSESLSSVIGSQIEQSMEGVLSGIKKMVFSAQKIAEKQEGFTQAITDEGTTIQQFVDTVSSMGSQVNGQIGTLPKSINAALTKKTEGLKTTLNDLKKGMVDLKSQVDGLSKTLMSKRK